MEREELEYIHKQSRHSKENLRESNIVGCFSCTTIYTFDEIDKFVNGGDTALCPYCSIDAVIPLHQIPKENYRNLLNEMNAYYFQSPL